MHLILRSIKLVRTDTRRKTRSKYEVTEIVHDCEQETHIIVVDKLLNRTSKPKLFVILRILLTTKFPSFTFQKHIVWNKIKQSQQIPASSH